MRVLTLTVIIILAGPAWGMARNPSKCQAYLLAPSQLKTATFSLLNEKANLDDRVKWQRELTDFVSQAPLNSKALADYLESLGNDSPRSPQYSIEAFSGRLLVAYLMRKGNADLAIARLPSLLNSFWTSVLDLGPDNEDYMEEQGHAWIVSVLRFFSSLAQSHPEQMRFAWQGSYNQFSKLAEMPVSSPVLEEMLAYFETRDTQVDPIRIKTRQPKIETAKARDALRPPSNVRKAIDAFRDSKDQAKHFDGTAATHRETILEFADEEYAKRLHSGVNESFNMLGNKATVVYVVVDASAGLTQEDSNEFIRKFGKEAADALIERDISSLSFRPQVLEQNYPKVVEALKALPKDLQANLFKPMLMRAKPGAADVAKKYARNADELQEIIKALKIKNHIR